MPENFNPDEYVSVDENISKIYVRLAVDFGWDLDEGAEYDFSSIIESFLGGNEAYLNLGINIAPILKILNK